MFLVSRITLSMLLSLHAFYCFSITDHEELTHSDHVSRKTARTHELSYFASQWVRCVALWTGLYRLYRDALVKVILKLLLAMNWADWRKAFCCTWSRSRHPSPSVPGDRYLKRISQTRAPGRNHGGNRLVRCSGTTSGDTALLVFSLRMRISVTLNTISYGSQISA